MAKLKLSFKYSALWSKGWLPTYSQQFVHEASKASSHLSKPMHRAERGFRGLIVDVKVPVSGKRECQDFPFLGIPPRYVLREDLRRAHNRQIFDHSFTSFRFDRVTLCREAADVLIDVSWYSRPQRCLGARDLGRVGFTLPQNCASQLYSLTRSRVR